VRIDDPHGYQMERSAAYEEVNACDAQNVLNWGDKKLRRAGELCA